jgi:hypothetical protein
MLQVRQCQLRERAVLLQRELQAAIDAAGTQFTGVASTKVQHLTPEEGAHTRDVASYFCTSKASKLSTFLYQ